jgi:hypothetical protein
VTLMKLRREIIAPFLLAIVVMPPIPNELIQKGLPLRHSVENRHRSDAKAGGIQSASPGVC